MAQVGTGIDKKMKGWRLIACQPFFVFDFWIVGSLNIQASYGSTDQFSSGQGSIICVEGENALVTLK